MEYGTGHDVKQNIEIFMTNKTLSGQKASPAPIKSPQLKCLGHVDPDRDPGLPTLGGNQESPFLHRRRRFQGQLIQRGLGALHKKIGGKSPVIGTLRLG